MLTLLVFFFSCQTEETFTESSSPVNSSKTSGEKVNVFGKDYGTLESKSTSHQIKLTNTLSGITFNDEFHVLNKVDLEDILNSANFNFSALNYDDLNHINLYYKDTANAITNLKGLSIFYTFNGELIHKYYNYEDSVFTIFAPFTSQVKNNYYSFHHLLHSFSLNNYNGNSHLLSLKNSSSPSHSYDSNSSLLDLQEVLYNNLDFSNFNFALYRINPETCGNPCTYGQSFENCDTSFFACEKECICCEGKLSQNLEPHMAPVDFANAYSFRDGFLMTNQFTKKYINYYYLIGDIYCYKDLYDWSKINTYYNVYSIINNLATNIQDSNFTGILLTNSNAAVLENFIDGEIASTTNELTKNIYADVKDDISFFKGLTKSQVLAEVKSR